MNGSFPSFDTDLLALWRFDNNTNDDKGSHSGSLKGGASFSSQGYLNEALYLLASSLSYVKAPNFINMNSVNFTIEMWIRIESFTGTNMTLLAQIALALYLTNDGIVLTTGMQPSSGTQLSANRWYHIALTYDCSLPLQQIYIDGKLDSTSTVSISFLVGAIFYIGTFDGTSKFFNGEIDHLSITTRIKSPCEILRDASLVAFYPFMASQLDATVDLGPYGIHASINWIGDFREGVVNEAIELSYITNYFQVFLHIYIY